MTEQTNEELSSKEIFQQALSEDANDAPQEAPQEPEAAEPMALDHEPTKDDSDEYWKDFAISKGWKENSDDVDPAFYTGYKAFVKNHERIQGNRESRSEIKELRKQMDGVVQGQSEILKLQEAEHQKAIDDLRTQLENKKAQAKEDLDFDAFEKADSNLKDLEASTAKAPAEAAQSAENNVYVSYRNDNPEIMHSSDSFDPKLNSLVEAGVNERVSAHIDQSTGQWKDGMQPSEYQIIKYLDESMKEAKSGLVRYQEQPARKPPPTNSTKSSGGGKVALDPNNLDALSRKQYDHYMSKGWKDVAETVLKDALGA